MEEPKLDPEIVEAFMHGFYGYGDYDADVWFVGMEEGLGSTDEIRPHLETWRERGERELEDLRDFQLTKGNNKHFTGARTLQRTWKGLGRMMLGGTTPASVDQVRAFQAERLGRHGGDNSVIELMPLPASSVAHWPYPDLVDLPQLETRERYRDEVMPWRMEHLRARVREYRPKAVVFYGMSPISYVDSWRAIAAVDLEERSIRGHRVLLGHDAHTRFIVTKHMVAHGISNDFLDDVGRLIEASRR